MSVSTFRVALACSALPLALAAGWFTQPARPSAETVLASSRVRTPRLEHPNFQAGIAARALQNLGFGLPPVPVGDVAPEPPALDIAVEFRRDLTAVVRTKRQVTLWVIDRGTTLERRSLKKGQEFRDGWLIDAITEKDVSLRKNDEVRTIPIVGSVSAEQAG